MGRTEEKHLFSNREIGKLLVPIMVEQLLNSLMGMADTMMVSNIGSAAISAVSLVDSINILVIQAFAALAAGGTIICSQYLGQGSLKKAQKAAEQMLLSVTALAAAITLLCLILRLPLLHLIFGSVDTEVMHNSETYFFYTLLSFPFIALHNAGSAIFRAQQNTRTPMAISVISNLMNIAGNAVLIWAAGLGVAGAAIATLISRIFCALTVMILLRGTGRPISARRKPYVRGGVKPGITVQENEKRTALTGKGAEPGIAVRENEKETALAGNDAEPGIVIRNYRKLRPDWACIRRVLAIGVPSGVENSMFQFGKLAIQSTVSTLGTVAIAAQAMTNLMEAMNGICAVGVGIGLMTVTGQCIGAGREDEAVYYIKKFSVIAEAVVLVSCLLVYVLAGPITVIGGMEEESARLCIFMTGVITVVKPLLWTFSFIPAYGMRAAGDVKYSMTVTCLSMWLFRVTLCMFLCRNCGFGPIGVWIGMFTDWAVRGILFTARFHSRKWLRHRVIEQR